MTARSINIIPAGSNKCETKYGAPEAPESPASAAKTCRRAAWSPLLYFDACLNDVLNIASAVKDADAAGLSLIVIKQISYQSDKLSTR